MKLMIGSPSFGAPDPLFTSDSLAPLMYHIGRRHPEITEVVWARDTRTYRHHARQGLAEEFLARGMDYLLTLDDDQTFTPQAFDILWEHNQYPCVSGLYFTRTFPPVPCMFRYGKIGEGSQPILTYPKDALLEVEIVGFGFCLFQSEVFKKVPPPWFQAGSWLGEDVAFAAKCRACGIPFYVHTGCKVGHIYEQKQVITEDTYEYYRAAVEAQERSKVGDIVGLGPSGAGNTAGQLAPLSRADVDARVAAVLAEQAGRGGVGGWKQYPDGIAPAPASAPASDG